MKPRIFETPADLFQGAAEEFANRAPQALKDHGRFCVALSGGSTPKRLFSLLASGKFSALPWKQIFLFWGDERYVPSDAPESNFRMTKEALLSKVPIPTENVFRIKTEISPSDKAAADYEQTLKTFFNLQSGELPRFDLTLNGVGTEGHTASLFPHSSALDETSRLVVADFARLKRDKSWVFIEAGPGSCAGTGHEGVFKGVARALLGDRRVIEMDRIGGGL